MTEWRRGGRLPNAEATAEVAEAADAIAATLSARLDALVASWELAIRARSGQVARAEDGAVPREPAEVLAELERELNGLESHCATLREAIDVEDRAALEWETRAMLSVQEQRDDLAKQALARRQEHVTASEAAMSEAGALEAVRDAYRHAVAAVRMTVDG